MKAKSVIHLSGGAAIRTPWTLDEAARLYMTTINSKIGSLYEIPRLTDHGSVKRCFIPAGYVSYFEEA